MPDDGKPQAGSALASSARAVHAKESIEDPFERIRRNTRSIILDHKPALGGVRINSDLDRPRRMGRIAQRVVQQV